jgi:D-3-phosphoglycerate dehydrogenase
MATARDIAIRPENTVSHSLSVSPTATFHSPPSSFQGGAGRRTNVKQLKPFNTGDIKILLLENVNQSGRDLLQGQGYQVEFLKTSLPETELIEKIRYVAAIPDIGVQFSPPPLPLDALVLHDPSHMTDVKY